MRVREQTHEVQSTRVVRPGLARCLLRCVCGHQSERSTKGFLKQRPDWQSKLVYCGGSLSDEFGAELVTYAARRRNGLLYSRHFLVSVQGNGPLADMRIENEDEILFINDDFTQELSHEAVLELFEKVKVDGHTRFSIIFQRICKKRHRRIRNWIKTSAILEPDSHPHFHDDHPTVEDVEYKKVENNRVEIKTTNRYKISGTQLYLDIHSGMVTADVYMGTTGDSTKIIHKLQRFWQDSDGQVHFEAALCDQTEQHYIAVGPNNEITLLKEPVWFEQSERGSDILFRHKDRYLAYNRELDQVDAQVAEFMFEEIPGEVEIESTVCSGNVEDNNGYRFNPDKNCKGDFQGCDMVCKQHTDNDIKSRLHNPVAYNNCTPDISNKSWPPESCDLNVSGSSGYISIGCEGINMSGNQHTYGHVFRETTV